MTVRVWHLLVFLLVGVVLTFFIPDAWAFGYLIVGIVIFTILIEGKDSDEPEHHRRP